MQIVIHESGNRKHLIKMFWGIPKRIHIHDYHKIIKKNLPLIGLSIT